MGHLVRARKFQENSAAQRLAFARRQQSRAHDFAAAEARRIEVLAQRDAVVNAGAFVAAAVALQSAAATYASAVGDAAHADGWVVLRQQELTEAARSRQTAEELRDRAQAEQDAAAAQAEQRELDEIAGIAHGRQQWTRHQLARKKDRP